MNKSETVVKFIDYVKSYDVTSNGRITSTTIEKEVNYCKRQFDRIFKEYSKYTPLETAERFRLLSCVENIRNGETLIETAIQYDYTPEGLSNAIRTKLNLNVMKIKEEGFELGNHIKISNTMVQIGQYKYQMKKEQYIEYVEALDEERIIKKITSHVPELDLEKGIELHFDLKKTNNILNKFDGCKIDKNTYESVDFQETVIMYVILMKEYDSGNSKVEMLLSEMKSHFFLIRFFFNIENLNLNNNYYNLTIKEDLRKIVDGLYEIEETINESFDIILQSTVKGNTVITQFNPIFQEMMMMVNESV